MALSPGRAAARSVMSMLWVRVGAPGSGPRRCVAWREEGRLRAWGSAPAWQAVSGQSNSLDRSWGRPNEAGREL